MTKATVYRNFRRPDPNGRIQVGYIVEHFETGDAFVGIARNTLSDKSFAWSVVVRQDGNEIELDMIDEAFAQSAFDCLKIGYA